MAHFLLLISVHRNALAGVKSFTVSTTVIAFVTYDNKFIKVNIIHIAWIYFWIYRIKVLCIEQFYSKVWMTFWV